MKKILPKMLFRDFTFFDSYVTILRYAHATQYKVERYVKIHRIISEEPANSTIVYNN
jgi:hypothetical protein